MILRRCSKKNGIVTTPIVRSPRSLATLATTGAAPVPVPPPIVAVTNTIFVRSSSSWLMLSMLLSASARPTSGLLPAPRPAPSCNFTGTGDCFSEALSVLQTANDTPWMPSLYMRLTALQPPPPTPITLMMSCIMSSTMPKSNSPSIFRFDFYFACKVTKYSSYFQEKSSPQALRHVVISSW